MERVFSFLSDRPQIVAALVACGLAFLPLAAWLDLRVVSDAALRQQAADLSGMMGTIRRYYAENVVSRVLSAGGHAEGEYREIDGAIPLPATLSIELSALLQREHSSIRYAFLSDHPFSNRPPHALDGFEIAALAAFRGETAAEPPRLARGMRQPSLAPPPPGAPLVEVSGSIFDRRIRFARPVVMVAACVSCHNTHPDSLKRDWKLGDVRGIEELTIHKPIADSVLSFKFLIAYFAMAAGVGLTFATLQWRLTRRVRSVNAQLEETNGFLSAISVKLARYLSPQIYRSIFKGERDDSITTERKKLTIFFSDIKDFTATTERLQPEELTALLNEYLTEMAAIALAHGATIDKYIGDAMLVFFGDPETRGPAEDAKACVRMAVAMQRRMEELRRAWRRRGIETPFAIRCGINTGYCNVGNFGSAERMDYTIIGAEANLAARLESSAEAGGVVMSYETFALVRDIALARPMEPIRMKGISREITPYRLEHLIETDAASAATVAAAMAGLDLFVDPGLLTDLSAAEAEAALSRALDTVRARRGATPATKTARTRAPRAALPRARRWTAAAAPLLCRAATGGGTSP